MTFVREIVFRPAYDLRNEGKGQHCVDLLFYLKGEKGVIQFMLMTGWDKGIIAPPTEEWDVLHTSLNRRGGDFGPLPADLGYHSPVPVYEGQHDGMRPSPARLLLLRRLRTKRRSHLFNSRA